MPTWQPPIPYGALYSRPARDLGPAVALLAWCYDNVRRDGWCELSLKDAAGAMDEPYYTVVKWWQKLRISPFLVEIVDRGKEGFRVRFGDEWIDWRILSTRGTPTTQVPQLPVLTIENTQEVTEQLPSKTLEILLNDSSNTDELSEQAIEQTVYKEDQESRDKKGRPSRKRAVAPRDRDVIFESLAEVCRVDWQVCTKEQRDQLNQSVGILRRAGGKAGKGDDDIAATVRYVAEWFSKNDWRGKKGETPTPAAIREVWGAAIADRDKRPAYSNGVNGSHPTGPPPVDYAEIPSPYANRPPREPRTKRP